MPAGPGAAALVWSIPSAAGVAGMPSAGGRSETGLFGEPSRLAPRRHTGSAMSGMGGRNPQVEWNKVDGRSPGLGCETINEDQIN